MPAPGGIESADDGLPDAGRAVTTVDAAGVDLGRRLDQIIVIWAGPRSDPPSWPAQLAIHGWAAGLAAARAALAFGLSCSIAASGEGHGGWENGRIAALAPGSQAILAAKIARHGADEDKHGRIFNAFPTPTDPGVGGKSILVLNVNPLAQRQLRSSPDDRRIASAAVCVTPCKTGRLSAVSACPDSGIGAGPAQADGTAVTAGASPGWSGAASFRSSHHGGLSAHAVTHGHQPRADYLIVSAHIDARG